MLAGEVLAGELLAAGEVLAGEVLAGTAVLVVTEVYMLVLVAQNMLLVQRAPVESSDCMHS